MIMLLDVKQRRYSQVDPELRDTLFDQRVPQVEMQLEVNNKGVKTCIRPGSSHRRQAASRQ